MAAKDHDPVNHPRHYTGHPSGVEAITITEHMGFCLGNAMKYLWRADMKNGLEDLEKARWYIEREIAKRKLAQPVLTSNQSVESIKGVGDPCADTYGRRGKY